MADDYYQEEYYTDQREATEHKPDLVKDLRKQLKEHADARKALEVEHEKLRGQIRESTIGRVLEDKGVPTKVARLIPASVESTPEAVEQWLGEFGDVFNIQRATPPPNDGSTAVTTANEAAQMQQMTELASTAQPPNGSGRVTEEDFAQADSLDAIRALIARGGVS